MDCRNAGDKIRKMRINAGFSQNELAERTQLSLRTIQRIENSETAPRGYSLKRISEVLGIKVEELIAGEETAEKKTVPNPGYVPKDKWVSLALRISPLSYLINPILSVLSPIIICKLIEAKLPGAKRQGRKVIEVQLIWLVMIGLMYGYIVGAKFFHWPVSQTALALLIVIQVALYYLNAVFIVIEILWWAVSKKINKKILQSFN